MRSVEQIPSQTRQDGFAGVYERTYGEVFRYLLRRCSHEEEARELTADVFTLAWEKWDTVPLDEGRRPWLFRTAFLLLRNHQRRTRRHRMLLQRLEPQPVDRWPGIDERLDVVRALTTLRGADQEVLRLAAWEGLNHTEIAVVLGCSVNAARVRLHRARDRLTKALHRPPTRTGAHHG